MRAGPAAALRPTTRASTHGLRLALAGGGTGGHIVPGLNLLAHARAATGAPLEDLVWFTSGRPVEAHVLAAELPQGFASLAGAGDTQCERVVLPLEDPRGGAPSRPSLVLRTPAAVLRARAALVAHQSDVLLGLGGFTSLPAVLAARSLSIPVALLEINAEVGSATRWLSRFAARVFHAWRATVPGAGASSSDRRDAWASRRDLWIGPPLAPRFQVCASGSVDERAARLELGFEPDRELLLVLGGSQGAGALNRFLCAHAPALVAHGLQILHQTGTGKLDEGCPAFSGYRAVEYIARVERALCAATLVLCRGGASTLAEIAALRRPAVVVPYPHHADRHQERNARELGAGLRIVDETRLGLGLRQELCELCSAAGASERARMSAALAGAVPTDAAARLWAELVALKRERS